MLLLLVLQFFWLRKEFNDLESSFYRETHSLLRNTLFEMTDSLILKSLRPLDENHSLKHVHPDSIWHSRVSLEDDTSSAAMEIFISSQTSEDTLSKVLRPIVSRFRNIRGQKRFTVKLTADSLSLEKIEQRFKEELAKIGIELAFSVKRQNRPEFHNAKLSTGTIVTPGGQYSLEFKNLPSHLLLTMLPQILFSVFLTVLTAGSFIVMYRSIILQQKLIEIKNGFISNITHELKTPITTVSVALEALKNFKGLENPQRTQEYLNIAEAELQRLSLLTDKVLKSALFEEGKTNFRKEKVDVAKLIDQVVQSLRLILEKKDGSISVTHSGSNFNVTGDSDHLKNVFYNLIDNSIKYSNDGVIIKVSVSAEAEFISVVVEDNGIGIPEEHHKRIFEKFYRVPTGDVHNIKGYGLGLSYVSSVVRSHNGTIRVTSEINQGSRFEIILPGKHEDQNTLR